MTLIKKVIIAIQFNYSHLFSIEEERLQVQKLTEAAFILARISARQCTLGLDLWSINVADEKIKICEDYFN